MVFLTSTSTRMILNGLNGLATSTTWTIVARLINLCTALVFAGQVDQRDVSLLALSCLLIGQCLWFGELSGAEICQVSGQGLVDDNR